MTSPYQDCVAIALAELQTARRELTAEISAYPTPISGCDAQFNGLLSDRMRISNALQALEDQPFVPTPRAISPGARIESR